MKKIQNLGNFKSIDDYVTDKIERFKNSEKNLKSLFEFMFSEKDNVFAEINHGYRIEKITYGQCRDQILKIATSLSELIDLPKNSIVGLHMQNSVSWIQIFWALIYCGYRPLLVNTRLSDSVLEGIFRDYSIELIISDVKEFSVKTIISSSVKASDNEIIFPSFCDEIFFMSSGTTENVKLCAYNGKNLFYQVIGSAKIIKDCPQMKKHFEGELKQLTLLPFYHIFGFSAVYLWFCFFSRTMVFLKDIRPQTLISTIKIHKVTHIFAVPLVWETIYKEAMKKIAERGEKTLKKFKKALKLANGNALIKNVLIKTAFKEIRDNIFGDSISFLISGGSMISGEVLAFFNGIGYHMANGYGMTEVGITSVELSQNAKTRNSASIGKPFDTCEYKISDGGQLLIRSKTRADKILVGGRLQKTDYDEWFNTNDIIKTDGEHYFIEGRVDDLIISRDGENLNPVIIENSLEIADAESLCLLKINGEITLVIQGKNCFLNGKIEEIEKNAKEEIKKNRLESVIDKIIITADSLIADDYKISRLKLEKRIKSGAIKQLSSSSDVAYATTKLEKEICDLFCEVLGISANFDVNADFFIDLGGSSLDYFTLCGEIKTRYNVDVADKNSTNPPSSIKEICQRLQKNN